MTQRLAHLCLAPLLAVALHGCGPASNDSEARSSSPEHEIAALEERLLAPEQVRLAFQVTSSGAVESDLSGTLELAGGGRVMLVATGSFAGQAVDLALEAEDGEYTFGNGPDRSVQPVPAHLREALVVGLTRMGLLHNLARLSGGQGADRADGGVREWVTFGDVTAVPESPGAVTFTITVAGQSVGTASLEIDGEGRPVIRRQTVQFPEGEMRVVERYSEVEIGG